MPTLLLILSACFPTSSSGAVSLPLRPKRVEVPKSPERWPLSSESLRILPIRAPRNLEKRGRVFLVGGHADRRGRDGNRGVHGQVEAEVNLATSEFVHDALAALDRFDLVLGRRGEQRPSYDARIAHAKQVRADAFIELHTDARGAMEPWATTPDGSWVHRSDGWTGFSVLYRDSGWLKEERAELARDIARSLIEAGFPPYGDGYGWMYDPDPEVPGVFMDRRGLKMLRGPSMPSVIIETHNAKDFDESLRWRESHVQEAFSAALGDALTRFFTREGE
jgi:N-acetylmuramoyl-L-alanine amidase